ncbi:glycosyltransferase family 2 protein [Corynebacterium sp. J010B-136]|uniref:glycosyltransferase family 2 protein n=1 Tax=Corynebacterium sp. J010B-136 TaxID=2099401 RepID=UPI0035162759
MMMISKNCHSGRETTAPETSSQPTSDVSRTISVVIPCRNDGALLERTLESLGLQTLAPNEIIVVDNASTDKTQEVAKKYGARIIYESQPSVLRATAAGFDAARSDVILRTDADVIIPSDFIEQVHRAWTLAELASGKSVIGITGSARFELPGWKGDLISRIYLRAYQKAVGSTLGHVPLFGTNCSILTSWWHEVRSHLDLSDPLVHDDMHISFAVRANETIWLQDDLSLDTDPRPLFGLRQLFTRFHRGFHTIFVNWKTSPPHRRLQERKNS